MLIDLNPEISTCKLYLNKDTKKANLELRPDYMWNNAVNDWALSFLQDADIMVESKAKNLASIALYKYLTEGEVWQDINHPRQTKPKNYKRAIDGVEIKPNNAL